MNQENSPELKVGISKQFATNSKVLLGIFFVVVIAGAFMTGFSSREAGGATTGGNMVLKTKSFQPSEAIPQKYTCDGADVSPDLTWEDAHGAPPTIPFWRGEAPARTPELSTYISNLREKVHHGFTTSELIEMWDWIDPERSRSSRTSTTAPRCLSRVIVSQRSRVNL